MVFINTAFFIYIRIGMGNESRGVSSATLFPTFADITQMDKNENDLKIIILPDIV